MTDATVIREPDAARVEPAAPPDADAAPASVASPPTGGGRSRAWIGVLAGLVVVALLAGATAVLFVRVQEAQDRADEAVTIAQSQDALRDQLAAVEEAIGAVETSGAATADDLDAIGDQVSALRRCVNNALDGIAQSTQSGRPASITKC